MKPLVRVGVLVCVIQPRLCNSATPAEQLQASEDTRPVVSLPLTDSDRLWSLDSPISTLTYEFSNDWFLDGTLSPLSLPSPTGTPI